MLCSCRKGVNVITGSVCRVYINIQLGSILLNYDTSDSVLCLRQLKLIFHQYRTTL